MKESKEEQKGVKNLSNVFSNNSFGNNKKKVANGLQNKDLDIILNNSDSMSDDSKNSLDLNLGK